MSHRRIKCTTCGTTVELDGSKEIMHYMVAHRDHAVVEICPSCGGSGSSNTALRIYDDPSCHRCKGEGSIKLANALRG